MIGPLIQNAFNSRDECLRIEKPVPGDIVVAIEHVTREGRQYIVVKGDESGDELMEYVCRHYLPHESKRSGTFCNQYAFHELVRAGVRRRVMFDVDASTSMSLQELKSFVTLLQKTFAVAYNSFGNLWETDTSAASFSVALSDDKAPYKGFHMVWLPILLPQRSIARLYEKVKALLSAEGQLGKTLASFIDPKPAQETFTMRLYGSGKVMNGKLVRQKRSLCIDDDSVFLDDCGSLLDYLIQPAPSHTVLSNHLSEEDLDEFDVSGSRSTSSCVADDQLGERLAKCELLNGWEVRGEVKTGTVSGRTWYRADLDLKESNRQHCTVCDKTHGSRTDYLWLTGEGLVDPTKIIYVRCRSRVQTDEEKAAANYRYNVVETIEGEAEAPALPALQQQEFPFSFEGYTGTTKVTPMTAFLKPQRLAHEAKLAELGGKAKAETKAKILQCQQAAIAHYEQSMLLKSQATAKQADPLGEGLRELDEKGADYALYGRQHFYDLPKRVYSSEYEMLCAIHCNTWTHATEGSAIWTTHWSKQNWSDSCFTASRHRMLFKVEAPNQEPRYYAGKRFWMEIVDAYHRADHSFFMGRPLGRAAMNKSVVWKMRSAINTYGGLESTGLEQHYDPSLYAEHCAEFEHFLRFQIAGEGDEYYRYLMNWLASAMQRPDKKIGVALLVRGPMGCGKSLFLSLLEAIVPHAATVTNKGLNTLTDKFNTDIDERTLYMFGEVPESAGLTQQQVAQIKTLITDTTAQIEAKNQTLRRVEQRLNIIIASNMLNCIETSEGDRRWCALDTPFPRHEKEDVEYFDRVYPLFSSDKAFQASIQYLLLNYVIGDFRPSEYPRSEALQITKNVQPVIDYALKYPGLAQRVTEYLSVNAQRRGPTLRDVVMCYRCDEGGDSTRGATPEEQEKSLYYAMHNIPQLAARFRKHPQAVDGRLQYLNEFGNPDVLKNPIVFVERESEADPLDTDQLQPSSNDCMSAMTKMIAAMKSAGLDVADYLRQFPQLDEKNYGAMNRTTLRALLKSRGQTYTGRDSIATLRARLVELDRQG